MIKAAQMARLLSTKSLRCKLYYILVRIATSCLCARLKLFRKLKFPAKVFLGAKDDKTWKWYGGGYRLNSFLPCNKKLGKYFTKGLQAGVLATALITGLTGCPSPTGNTAIEDDWHDTGDDTNKDKDKDKGDITTAFPDYYVTGDYLGQRFIETDADGANHELITKRFDSAFTNAKKYMSQKVAELQKDLHDKVTPDQIESNDFYKTLDAALKKSTNDQQYIGDNVKNNSENFAQYFAVMGKPLLEDHITVEEYNRYKLSYYQLSHAAYNRSLGGGANTYYGDDFPSNNGNMEDNGYSFLSSKLAGANISYQDLVNPEAENYVNKLMDRSLAIVAHETSADQGLLKKAVELALYNESLYGLHDLAIQCGINQAQINSLTKRRTLSFNDKIQAVIKQQTKTIDWVKEVSSCLVE